MGEIADALRRARSETEPRAPLRKEPATVHPVGLPAHRLESLQLSQRAPAGLQLALLNPSSPAIALQDHPVQNACRQVAVRLRAALEERRGRSVAIVSAISGEGKTTTCCNLALALASMSTGRDVALVELDLRCPSFAKVLALRVPAGIDEALAGNATLEAVRIEVESPVIDIYAALEPRAAAHELLTRQSLNELIGALESRYAVVIIDTPPMLPVPDTSLILERVSACVPIARAGASRARSFRTMIEALPRGRMLGTVLVGSTAGGSYGSYYYGTDPESAGL